MGDTTCPTCGTPCTVGGDSPSDGGTRYYVPAWQANQRAAYEEGAAAAQAACREVMNELREARDTIATLREALAIIAHNAPGQLSRGGLRRIAEAALDAGKDMGNG